MSIFMMILSGVGILAIIAVVWFFGLVIMDVEKDRAAARKHAKAVFDANGSALTGRFKDDYTFPKAILTERSTIPYVDQANFGTDDHYLLALAAPFNAQRCASTQTVGGYFDCVKLLDADHGPVSDADKEALRIYLTRFSGIKDDAQLNNILNYTFLNEMRYEVSQVLLANGHKTVPEDMLEFFNKETTDSYQRGIDKPEPSDAPLDLRSYRLMEMIHSTRIAATLEWIPERESWDHIRRIGADLRARVCRYKSWEDYGEMMLRCHKYLGQDAHVSKRMAPLLKALNREPWSPWQKLDLHHSETQKQFAKTVPPMDFTMPKEVSLTADFPELDNGQYMAAGERLMATKNCQDIGRLIKSDALLQVPQSTLDKLVAENPDHAGIHLLAGHHAIETGIQARGTKTANWVSDDAFNTLADRAKRACDLSERGLELAPDHHGFVGLVVAAADHTQADIQELWEKVFDLAGTTHLDDLALQMLLMRPLLEKWGGSPDASFGMAEDRMARSNNPLAGLLFLYAAVEFVGLPANCGGGDDRHKNMGLREDVHKAARDLLKSCTPEDLALVQSWLVYWAYNAGDREMLAIVGPFDGGFSSETAPWRYLGHTMSRVTQVLLGDIAATAAHPDWLSLTRFYEDISVPDAPLQ